MTEIMKFDDVDLVVIHRNGERWFTTTDIARALAYSDQRKVSHLYARHSDEFSEAMTMVAKLGTPSAAADGRGGGIQDVRVFSLRGAHLLGMLARTDRAKAFRRWVLDVLDGEATPQPRHQPRAAYGLLGDWRDERRRQNRIRHRLGLLAAIRAELETLGFDELDADLLGEDGL